MAWLQGCSFRLWVLRLGSRLQAEFRLGPCVTFWVSDVTVVTGAQEEKYKHVKTSETSAENQHIIASVTVPLAKSKLMAKPKFQWDGEKVPAPF